MELPAERAGAYPHELSGGQKQRVMIAMALACDPRLIIADEPTTALDVVVQAQVLELLGRLVAERGIALVMISHDLSVLSTACARIAVMRGGRVVEHGESRALIRPVPDESHDASSVVRGDARQLPHLGGNAQIGSLVFAWWMARRIAVAWEG